MRRSPNFPGSVNEIDFQTALGRLLRDASLREQFARNPSAVAALLHLRLAERAHLAKLSPGDIEIQATILLRKRFDAVRHLIPRTTHGLGSKAWELFQAHARQFWPDSPDMEVRDTESFCSHLAAVAPAALCPVEMNRLRFHLGRERISIHHIRHFPIRGRTRRALQVLVRRRHGWSEHALYFALD